MNTKEYEDFVRGVGLGKKRARFVEVMERIKAEAYNQGIADAVALCEKEAKGYRAIWGRNTDFEESATECAEAIAALKKEVK